jgi:putative thiazole-containing bacteriocin maturation protein
MIDHMGQIKLHKIIVRVKEVIRRGRMAKLNALTRLKVKRDTFFLPDPNGGVYFRNNSSSFRMEGHTIYQWIEKLMPMFDGEHTLGELTNGLPLPYQNRIYEIGET